MLVVWKLDRLGRNLAHLVNTVQDLSGRGVGLRVLSGQGAQIDTTTAAGRLVFGIFAALAEFERELIRERTLAGLTAAGCSRCRKPRAKESKTVIANKAMCRQRTFDYAGDASGDVPASQSVDDDPTRTIRVYFHWDGDRPNIVIGYCGEHLPVSSH